MYMSQVDNVLRTSTSVSDTPTTISTPRVPAELTDVMVDFLHDDQESLANCALVCKGWLPAAWYHLFRELLLHPWNLETFVDLISHPSATIVPSIQHLVIDQVKSRLWQIQLFDAMFLRFPLFDFVRKLEFQNFNWFNYPRPLRPFDMLVSAFQNVTNVKFDGIKFDCTTNLWTVVACFQPSLIRLSVAHSTFIIPFVPSDLDLYAQVPTPKINDFELRETLYYPTHIMDWFSSCGTLVESLSVALGSPALPSLNRYLQVLGSSLLSLQIDIRYIPADMYFLQLDLSFSTHLRKLRFCNFSMGASDALSSTTFARITSSDVTEIDFAFGSHSSSYHENYAPSTVPGPEWRALDDVLSAFSSLRTVRFISHDSPHLVNFIDYVKRAMPACHARGLLVFEPSVGERDIPPLYSHLTSEPWAVSGPFCIAQLQEPMAV